VDYLGPYLLFLVFLFFCFLFFFFTFLTHTFPSHLTFSMAQYSDKKGHRSSFDSSLSSQSSNSIPSKATNVDHHNNRLDPNDLLAERPDQGSNISAFFNIVCVVAGTGTLGLPFALAKGGWIGVGILVLSVIMSIYTGILVVKCCYYNGHTRLSSYHEVGQHAFGRIGLIAVWFFHTSIVLGAPVMYFILSGTEIRGLTKDHVDITDKAWIWICCSVVSVPFVLLKTLKEVSLLR